MKPHQMAEGVTQHIPYVKKFIIGFIKILQVTLVAGGGPDPQTLLASYAPGRPSWCLAYMIGLQSIGQVH